MASLISRRGKVFILMGEWHDSRKVCGTKNIHEVMGLDGWEYNPFISKESAFQGGSSSVQVAGRWVWGNIVVPIFSVYILEI